MPLTSSLQPFAVSLSCQLVHAKRLGGNLGFSLQGAVQVTGLHTDFPPERRLIACCLVGSAVMGMESTSVEGPTVVKAASDQRQYQVLKLPNGLTTLLIHDPAMSGPQPEDSHACGGGACSHDHSDDDDEDHEDYEEGEEDDDEGEDDDDDDDDEDSDGMEVDGARGRKRDHGHVLKPCCSNGKFSQFLLLQSCRDEGTVWRITS